MDEVIDVDGRKQSRVTGAEHVLLDDVVKGQAVRFAVGLHVRVWEVGRDEDGADHHEVPVSGALKWDK